MVQRDHMPAFEVQTSQCLYSNIVERGILGRVRDFLPTNTSKLFLVTTEDVWQLYGSKIQAQFHDGELTVLFFPGGEPNKKLAALEQLAEEMSEHGADRKSLVIGFGGGIVTDVSGFLAAVFMRGVPVLQIPTTLLAQVDAATGGKTGVNLRNGKNLIGSFHQPLAVLIDPDVLSTLPEREYRAGLFEVIKCGVIRDRALFDLFSERPTEILSLQPQLVEQLIAAAVRIKAEVVSADEKEGDLRRILNFGHTVGHAIEAETEYARFLHGEAVAWGMAVATELAVILGILPRTEASRVQEVIFRFGPLPPAGDLDADRLLERLGKDKKTLGGVVHFVLPTAIGQVKIVPNVERTAVRKAITETLR
jgi:3-dehydroquinate synthase